MKFLIRPLTEIFFLLVLSRSSLFLLSLLVSWPYFSPAWISTSVY